MGKDLVKIGELDHSYLALATSEAAAAIRCFPMTYGAKGIGFYAVMDTILLLYGVTLGASYIEVYRDNANRPTWSSIGEVENNLSKSVSRRYAHEFVLAGQAFGEPSLNFRIRVYPLDLEVEPAFELFPNVISMLFGRRKVAEITFAAIRFLNGTGAGRKPNPLKTLPEKRLYRELTQRVRFVVESQGEHPRLSQPGKSMPQLLLAQRTPIPRTIPEVGGYDFSYRYILAPQQFRALPREAREALEDAVQEQYRCRLDTTLESGSLTTHNRKPKDLGPRIYGEMNPSRLKGLLTLRQLLDLEGGCFQFYVPIHVKGTVAFTVAFHLPMEDRLDAFSVYANFIPTFAANLRQSVFETALSGAKTENDFRARVEQLCGERDKTGDKVNDGRLVRSEGIDAYYKIIMDRRSGTHS